MRTSTKIFKALLEGGLILLFVFGLAGQGAAQTWTQLTPTGGPPAARHSHTAVYDPGSNRMIVFGGRQDPVLFNDVWVLTNANGLGGTPGWIQLTPSGPAPAPRWIHGAGYDPASNTMIVFGGGLGSSSPCVNDVWLLSNANGLGGTATWTSLGTAGSVPGVRFAFAFAYAQALNRIIIAGGSDCFVWPYQDAFALSNANGLGGTATWTNLAPTGTFPLPFGSPFRGASVYDPVSDRLIIWGPDALSLSQLLILSAASGISGTPSWNTLTLTTAPAASPNGSVRAGVYNASANRALFFGGDLLSGGQSNQTWRLNNANGLSGMPAWAQVVAAAPTPPARSSHSAVYDSATDRMVVFGGVVNPPCCTPFNDVWVLTNAVATATATLVSSSANPSVFGQAATFTATVTPSTGPGTPTGTVAFNDGATTIGTGTLSGGEAAFMTSSLSVGSHTITAVYSGDSSFSGSISEPLTQTVNKASTQTTVNSSANPATLKQSVTFTANVSVASPGSGIPTGTVTFQDGATVLETVTLSSSGSAMLATSSLSVGSHSITVTYSGDGNFNSSSGSITQQVAYGIRVLYDQTKSVKSGATFPIKLYLCDVSGNDVSSSAIVLHATQVVNLSGSAGAAESPGSANPDSDFRFDSTLGPAGGYIFNLSTKGLAPGTYSLQFAATGDPVTHSVNFGVS